MTDTTTLAPTEADLARLRFFRDLTGDERMKVLRVFGAIPLGAESEVTSHYIERLLFDRMLAKWGAPAPASAFDKDGIREAGLAYARSEGHGYPVDSADAYLAGWLSLYMAAPPAQEARVPLSTGQIEQGHDAADIAPTDATIGTFTDGVRFAEKHHGITAAQKETP